MMNIIIKPVITEKMTEQSDIFNRFAFVVDRCANKIEIKKAIESTYDVTVESVRTMVCIGKKRSRSYTWNEKACIGIRYSRRRLNSKRFYSKRNIC